MSDTQIRPATLHDLAAIDEIYTHYILNTHITFDVEPYDASARRAWFSHYSDAGRHRALVACDGERVVGWATSSRFRPKAAYDTSVETTIYLAPDATGRGAGRTLYAALFDALAGEDVHRAYAGIAIPNEASIALHERFGFARVAYFTEQGRKFGRYWDVAWYEKVL